MILDSTRTQINSQLIVTLAKQALNNTNREPVKGWHDSMPGDLYRKDFGTVKISLPRQSGHTTAALQLIVEHPDSLAFVMRSHTKDVMLSLLREYTTDEEVTKRVENSIIRITDNALKNIRPVEYRPFIIFDRVSLIRQDVYEHIKESFNAGVIVELQ